MGNREYFLGSEVFIRLGIFKIFCEVGFYRGLFFVCKIYYKFNGENVFIFVVLVFVVFLINIFLVMNLNKGLFRIILF